MQENYIFQSNAARCQISKISMGMISLKGNCGTQKFW